MKNIAVDDDLFAVPGRLERTSLWKEVVSRCLELRLTINKRLEAEGGEGVGSGTDVMSADHIHFLHGVLPNSTEEGQGSVSRYRRLSLLQLF